MNGFERRKHVKIKQLFAACLSLVSQYGFDKVSVNEIAAKARVSPATIYNYFGTKDQLYIAMLQDWFDTEIEAYTAVLQSGKSFKEKIRDIITLEARNLTFLAELSQGNDPARVQYFLVEVEERLEQFFYKLVHTGKQEGDIAENLSDQVLLRHFKLFFREFGELLHADGRNNVEGQDEEVEQLLHLFFYGIAPVEVT